MWRLRCLRSVRFEHLLSDLRPRLLASDFRLRISRLQLIHKRLELAPRDSRAGPAALLQIALRVAHQPPDPHAGDELPGAQAPALSIALQDAAYEEALQVPQPLVVRVAQQPGRAGSKAGSGRQLHPQDSFRRIPPPGATAADWK